MYCAGLLTCDRNCDFRLDFYYLQKPDGNTVAWLRQGLVQTRRLPGQTLLFDPAD